MASLLRSNSRREKNKHLSHTRASLGFTASDSIILLLGRKPKDMIRDAKKDLFEKMLSVT